MKNVWPGDVLLAVTSSWPFTVDGGDPVVFMLGHVHDGQLFVAPMGSRAFADDGPAWMLVGPVADLPNDHYMGRLADAYRAAASLLN